MPQKTDIYKLEYPRRGGYVSATSDYRRFVTLDYNLQSYIGIIGVGVIDGWTLEDADNLKIKILPGEGIINGYYMESPYSVKQRSQMIIGEREVDAIRDLNQTTQSYLADTDTNAGHYHFITSLDLSNNGNLGNSIGSGIVHIHSIVSNVVVPNLGHTHILKKERWNYIKVIQDYDPSYNPSGDIVNLFVKVVVPSEVTLTNDADNYVYAVRPSGRKPYPLLNDYPPDPGSPPSRNSYNTYSDYMVALNAYNAKLAEIKNYEWYTSPDNHFTEVEFEVTTSYIVSSSRILLGKVVARNNAIGKIDVSNVDNLQNLSSEIRSFANEYITTHRHGGDKFYDPPKIRLETDIRNASLYSYDISNNRSIFNVLEKNETGITSGHKHTFKVDTDGNGLTQQQIGSTNPHFHKIISSIVQSPEKSSLSVQDHTHTIQSTAEQGDTWNAESRYVIYVNDALFADETTPNVHVDSTKKQITFDGKINISYSEYTCSFVSFEETYTYTAKSISVYRFMLEMITDYWTKYRDKFDEQGNRNGDPFTFYTDTTQSEIVGTSDLQNQSETAQLLLRNKGDQFVFTPNAANNITITLSNKGVTDNVEIEILGNTEVTGVLKSENIVYINADKISLGELDVDVIPFISHVGRFREQFYPLQYSMVSNDGFRYVITPFITDDSLGHYHRLLLDKDDNGATSDVLIDDDVVYYATGNDGNVYSIVHYHAVSEGNVGSSSSDGLLQWQNNITSANLTSSEHVHEIITPLQSDAKAIYSMKEDYEGNIYVGTSDGFLMIPHDLTYLFVVNEHPYYLHGDDLWSLFVDAVSLYENDTSDAFTVTESIYKEQIDNAFIALENYGDSVLIQGVPEGNESIDLVMIKKISYFKLPNFKYRINKEKSEVLDTEVIVEEITEEVVRGDSVTTEKTGEVIVERDFNSTPIWAIDIKPIINPSQAYVSSVTNKEFVVAGSNIIAKNLDIDRNAYLTWTSIDIPFMVGTVRNMFKSMNGDYWFVTNNGVLISREHSNVNAIDIAQIPEANPNIVDMIEGDKNTIYSISSSGVFKTIDGAKTWTKLLDIDGGLKRITKDPTLSVSNTVAGHYHRTLINSDGNGFLEESIGTGVPHVHQVDSGDILTTLGHTHSLIITLYVLDSNNILWRSIDSGLNWTKYSDLGIGNFGNIFAAYGKIFVSKSDGLYVTNGGDNWNKIFANMVYSFAWDYDIINFMIGTNNGIYETSDGSSFNIVHAFNNVNLPVVLENKSRMYFDYAYSNYSQTFHFKNYIDTSNEIMVLSDYEKWRADNGAWNNSSPYDIYIDFKRVLSTKFNEDKREDKKYYFNVDPINGIIDFTLNTDLTKEINVYDSSINVSNTEGFFVGDKIIIMSGSGSSSVTMYSDVGSVHTDQLDLLSRSEQKIALPAVVIRIPNLSSDSFIIGNIYDSLLSNIGKLTHDQIEDYLSVRSDGRPYKFNNAYLSNLLQLAQAVRYVYPNINDYFKNDLFYDFRYSWNPSDPIYPYIEDFIDVTTSEIHSQKVYDSNFIGRRAKSINDILIGYGTFNGIISVATDIGIFWANIVSNYESNWFYISSLPFEVYDISIFAGERFIAATEKGTYCSTDMLTWTLETAKAIYYPSNVIGLRWSEKDSIYIAPHTASFTPELGSNYGTIISQSGNLYSTLEENRGIKITGAGDKNGNYIIKEIADGGTGYGSKLVVSPSFSGPSEIINNVRMVMGSWWHQWNGDENISNANLTNALLIGGKDHISYNNDGDEWTWYESEFDISDFTARKFLTTTQGSVLCSATGDSKSERKNYLLESKNIGKTWDSIKTFEEVKGNILSFSISDQNNSVISVYYTQPQDFQCSDGVLDQRNIVILDSLSHIIYNGKIVWNENRNSENSIVIFGNEANNILMLNTNCKFVVYPSKIASMSETYKETVMFGTDRGIYYDSNSLNSGLGQISGSILSPGINGIINRIDISGKIIEVDQNLSSGNTVFIVNSDSIIRAGELTSKMFYVIETNPIEKYKIVSNSSTSITNECEIEIESTLTYAYKNKLFTIIGNTSRLYVDFSSPVLDNTFNGGKLYVTSDEYNNYGNSFNIVKNSTEYIDIDKIITPVNSGVGTDQELAVGQSIRLIDSSGKLTLWMEFDRILKENSLSNLNIKISNAKKSEMIGKTLIVYSNTKNSSVVNSFDVLIENAETSSSGQLVDENYSSAVLLSDGDTFVVEGMTYEYLHGFSFKKTSKDSDHSHNTNLVGNVVSGKIGSFGTHDASFVTINVVDTVNFNNSLVQYQGDLFKNAKIVFTNRDSYNLRYVSDVISHTDTTITVRFKSQNYWNFSSYDDLKVSEGWQWEIDGTNYGYTKDIIYDDFVVASTKITDTANRGSDSVVVEDSSVMSVGDKIRIQDDTLSTEINYVSQIVNLTTIKLSNDLSRTFYKNRNPQIKVLRDIFANTHTHQIRSNEVQTINISSYLNNGYPSEHSHRILPLITDVSSLLNKKESIIASGSGSIIFRSLDNGENWSEEVDLNDYLEGDNEVDGVSSMILNNNKIVAGATNGSLFVETKNGNLIIPLTEPL